jgi:Uma2 family endonuclease
MPVTNRPLTPEEYLRLEREALDKSEYYNGAMYVMSPVSPTHSLISANIGSSIGMLLRGRRCVAYGSDLRLCILAAGLYTYSTLSVFCEPMTFVSGTDDTATNPALIVEVLSKATEAYDRSRKFEAYRQLPSLREYLLVSQEAPTIERFSREGDDRWVLTTARGLDAVIPLDIIEASLPLIEVYDKVDFQRPESAPETKS